MPEHKTDNDRVVVELGDKEFNEALTIVRNLQSSGYTPATGMSVIMIVMSIIYHEGFSGKPVETFMDDIALNVTGMIGYVETVSDRQKNSRMGATIQ
jgi:hypothetical protein